MREYALTVEDAALNLTEVVSRINKNGESTILMKAGKPIAKVIPINAGSILGRDWLSVWKTIPHLDLKNADDFSEVLENAEEEMEKPKSQWD